MLAVAAYSAVCVRACALRSGRVGPDEWRYLTGLPSSREVIESLARTGRVSRADLGSADAEYELRQAFITQASKLARFSSGSLRRMVVGFISAYDLLNIETVLCHIHGGVKTPMPRLYDTGHFGLCSPAALASAGNLAVLGGLVRGTPVSRAFSAAVELYREDDDMAQFIMTLERAYVADWRRTMRGVGLGDASAMGSFLGMWVARAILRLRSRGEKSHVLVSWLKLLSNYPPSAHVLDRHAEPLELHAALARSIFPGPPDKSGAAPDSVWEAEAQGSRRVYARARRAESGLAFNADFLAGFLLVQHHETEGLVALIEGKDLGMKPSEIEALLVIS